jgi:16S rRNA (guanine966-N2)-methyltransferase
VRRSRSDARVVRIIGGAWKRTLLPVADTAGLRPTPDRVRETLFNWLAHRVNDFSTLRGLDLFAGSGALGFELASRGARMVTLIESDRQLVQALGRTREKLHANQVDIVHGDALSVAGRLAERSFDVVFVDPPYESGLLAAALAAAARLVTEGGWVYAEAPRLLGEADLAASGFVVVRSARAGRVHSHLLQRQVA